ncbi:DUF3224 domain-containing protein [Niveibacterium sp. SC-1]|uniref:DUF3224 domain-containing protein n=1 Tax=Niveibacterium sp. SC-1 TaxID=3135646 RepID=UPI00311EDA42
MSQQRASGTFQVKLSPLAPGDEVEQASGVGRMSLDKVFSGELQAHSKGVMIAFRTAVQGSAGYTALEQVTGTLAGRAGSFVLQHNGLMDRGAPSLLVQVVPDSGTDALQGLRGTMSIDIRDGQHFYSFDYTLDAPAD